MTSTGTSVSNAATHRVLFGAVAVGWLLLDQLTKVWAMSALEDRTIDVIWTLRFNLAINYGASFSLGTGFGAWIGLIALVVVGVLVWKGGSVRTRLGAVALGLIVGGALGNVLDRAFRGDEGFFHGGVVDWIDFQWWPIFNIADIGVVCGAVLLVISTVRDPGSNESIVVTDDESTVSTEDSSDATITQIESN